MNNNLFKGLKKNISLILKILAVCITLSLVLFAILFFINSQKNKNTLQNQEITEPERQLTQEELNENYQSSVINILESFDGNYQTTRNKLVELSGVPTSLINLHFDIVVSLDYLVFKDDKNSAKQRLEKIYQDYDWLKSPLEKVIQSIQ